MNKLLLYLLLAFFFMGLQALQSDEEMAMQAFFYAKHGLDRAVHAAVLQVQEESLSEGIVDLDAAKAQTAALLVLQENLQLDSSLAPRPGSYFRAPIELLALDVIGAEESFPYRYAKPEFDYEVTLQRPGAVMLVRVRYPRVYGIMKPTEWVVKAAAEVTN